ncbi:hypothetical protein PoB_000872700 [Plakobranchus ocellatus]|uniref:Uncharacterized protein n=1 Tax=Plakobranchus ocellatus TaxID=259542 RepID=A0AAV3YJ59_9GAST|nr:hypothetical protein PoB_000872700 [Plakobranchus ocellatus]
MFSDITISFSVVSSRLRAVSEPGQSGRAECIPGSLSGSSDLSVLIYNSGKASRHRRCKSFYPLVFSKLDGAAVYGANTPTKVGREMRSKRITD